MFDLNRYSPGDRISFIPLATRAPFAKFFDEIPSHKSGAIIPVVMAVLDLLYPNIKVMVLKAPQGAKPLLCQRHDLTALRARPQRKMFFKPNVRAAKGTEFRSRITREHFFSAAALAVAPERFLSHAPILYAV